MGYPSEASMKCGRNSTTEKSVFFHIVAGLDHGVGHPLLLLCHAKAPNYLKKKGFKDLPDYSKWPKVADAVIEALQSMIN